MTVYSHACLAPLTVPVYVLKTHFTQNGSLKHLPPTTVSKSRSAQVTFSNSWNVWGFVSRTEVHPVDAYGITRDCDRCWVATGAFFGRCRCGANIASPQICLTCPRSRCSSRPPPWRCPWAWAPPSRWACSTSPRSTSSSSTRSRTSRRGSAASRPWCRRPPSPRTCRRNLMTNRTESPRLCRTGLSERQRKRTEKKEQQPKKKQHGRFAVLISWCCWAAEERPHR